MRGGGGVTAQAESFKTFGGTFLGTLQREMNRTNAEILFRNYTVWHLCRMRLRRQVFILPKNSGKIMNVLRVSLCHFYFVKAFRAFWAQNLS